MLRDIGGSKTVIDLESDRMRSLAITPSTLESEREVVKEERRMRIENHGDRPFDLRRALIALAVFVGLVAWLVVRTQGT